MGIGWVAGTTGNRAKQALLGAWTDLRNGYSVISETKFWLSRPRPRLVFSQSQFRDRVRDWNFMSLNFETESETKILRVSISSPSPRLDLSESQYRDRVRDWNYLSLSLETESETIELVETETDTESLAILCSGAPITSFHLLSPKSSINSYLI